MSFEFTFYCLDQNYDVRAERTSVRRVLRRRQGSTLSGDYQRQAATTSGHQSQATTARGQQRQATTTSGQQRLASTTSGHQRQAATTSGQQRQSATTSGHLRQAAATSGAVPISSLRHSSGEDPSSSLRSSVFLQGMSGAVVTENLGKYFDFPFF